MKKNIKILGIVAALVAVIVLAGATTVFAQSPTETETPITKSVWGWSGGSRRSGRSIFGGQEGMEAAAEALGMTADELSTQLWGGKTLADLAEEADVDLQQVRDAAEEAEEAAREAAIRDTVEQAVEDGDISQEHADWLLEGLDNGYLGGGRFGGCWGDRGVRGFRGF